MGPQLQLTAEQRRVLGVLIEKSLATPEYYPMTLNSVLAASNQKSNRNPVVNYTEGDAGRVLYELMQMNLVVQADAAHGARVNRFEHRVHEELDWNRRHRAVMAELLLRGPQSTEPAMVRVLPRQPGRSAVRYDHTLYPPEELEAPASPTAVEPGSVQVAGEPDLPARVERLEAEVADLRTLVEGLRRRVGEPDGASA